VFLTRPPRQTPEGARVRLACIRHAASVNPEPGSNSPPVFSRLSTVPTTSTVSRLRSGSGPRPGFVTLCPYRSILAPLPLFPAAHRLRAQAHPRLQDLTTTRRVSPPSLRLRALTPSSAHHRSRFGRACHTCGTSQFQSCSQKENRPEIPGGQPCVRSTLSGPTTMIVVDDLQGHAPPTGSQLPNATPGRSAGVSAATG
jgi:hypothetical protein